jgi:hypothetical protein
MYFTVGPLAVVFWYNIGDDMEVIRTQSKFSAPGRYIIMKNIILQSILVQNLNGE